MKEIRIDQNGAGKRLDKFLFRYLSGAPRALIYAQLRKKNISLNGKKATGSELLCAGDVLQCWFSDLTWEKFLHPSLTGDFDERSCTECYRRHPEVGILYEDEDLLVLNKPAGLLSQRAEAGDESLNDWLLGYLLEEKKYDPEELAVFRPCVCHRLDRNTSGIVLCAKSLNAAQKTAGDLKMRRIDKYYLAIVHGKIERPSLEKGIWTRDPDSKTSRIVRRDETPDPAAVTTVTGCAPVLYDETEDVTLLAAKLFTGKTHQLRAQFAAMGHPIVGDRKYGGKRADPDRERFHAGKQLLHACYVVYQGREFFACPSGKAWKSYAEGLTQDRIRQIIENNRSVFGDGEEISG